MRTVTLVALLVAGLRAQPVQAQSPDSLLTAIQRLEAAGQWQQAIGPLERYLALRPGDAARVRQLGQYLTWQGDRERGVALLRRATELEPGHAEGLAALGEVLSWSPSTRAEAGDLFRRALAIDPSNARAREGQANLLAWSGHAKEALRKYDALLAESPSSVGALRGKGGALNQLQRFDEAKVVLDRAAALAPEDMGTAQELAATLLGLERFDDAASRLGQVHGGDTPELRRVQDSVRRARSTWAEASGLIRTRSNQLDAQRGELRVSPYLGNGWRLVTGWQPTRFRDSIGDFTSQAAGAGLRYQRSRSFDVSLAGGLRWTDGRPGTDWSGAFGLGWRPTSDLRVSVTAERALIDETRTSVASGVFGNVAAVGAEVLLLDRRIEVIGRAGAGVYTSDALADNRRLGGDLLVGWVVRSYQPYLRVGYAFMVTSFEENQAASGGYFSPDRFYVNYGTVTASQRISERLFWEFDGRVGGQVVVQDPSAPNDERLAAAVNTHLTWRAGRSTDLDLRYQYVDAFAAFRLHEVRLVFRQHF